MMLQSINKIHLSMVEMDRNHNPSINCNIISGVHNHIYFSFDQETNKTLNNYPIPEDAMMALLIQWLIYLLIFDWIE